MMRRGNIFFVLCALLMCVSVTYSMLITTRRTPHVFFNIQKRNNDRPLVIQVGKGFVHCGVDETFTSRDLPEIYDTIKKCRDTICRNDRLSYSNDMGACGADICCGRALFLGMHKNIQSSQKSYEIKSNFLESIGKKDRLTYVQDLEELYIYLVRHRVILNEFCSNTDWDKRVELHQMIKRLNLCLFNQVSVIMEDESECWKQNNFKMTPAIKKIRFLRTTINEWYKNEQEYSDQIEDEQRKSLYKLAMVSNNITTYTLNRIDEEYKSLHRGDTKIRE